MSQMSKNIYPPVPSEQIENKNKSTLLQRLIAGSIIVIGVIVSIFLLSSLVIAVQIGFMLDFMSIISEPRPLNFHLFLMIVWGTGFINAILLAISGIVFFINKSFGCTVIEISSFIVIILIIIAAYFLYTLTGVYHFAYGILTLLLILFNLFIFLIYPGKIKIWYRSWFSGSSNDSGL